ncbi:MAG: hypothetical protein HYZ00_02975, partial [Candidatus Hydrogenedentes bacterium]|nr:hypothetical protein [Candidatus Hydrogenedentota bacterium]
MPLSNCARCKQMFNKIGKAICPECEPAEEADYAKVRAIIDLDPNLNMEQAAEQAGVEIWVVNRMIDSGIITTVTASEKVYCGKCGAPAISMSKRLCEACLDRLNLE